MTLVHNSDSRKERQSSTIPWVFLIYHGFEDVTKGLELSVLSKLDDLTSVVFDGAPHNIPPGETYFSWFRDSLEVIAKKRGCLPVAILDADYFDKEGVVGKADVKEYGSHVQNFMEWSKEKGIKFLSVSREELFQN
jgi:hypothetical protein